MKSFIVERNGQRFVERTSGFTPADALVEFTDQIAEADVPYAIITDTVDAQGFPIKAVSVDGAAKAVAETIASKTAQITAAYETMQTEVLAQMQDVFETTDPASASAYYETWKDMSARGGSQYSGSGLKVRKQILNSDTTELFDAGAALDTPPKVKSFADRKLELAQEYGVWRMARIQQFEDERETIENS